MAIESAALTWAQHYLEQGFSVIPFNSKKKTGMVDWIEFQERIPTEKEIEEWFSNERQFKGMAIITGGISGIAVVDVDSHKDSSIIDKIKPLLPGYEDYPLVQSQSGGWHLYVKCNGELRGGINIPFKGTDLRANGNCIICPPSVGYEWKRKISPDKSNLKELSLSYIKELELSRKSATSMPENQEREQTGTQGTNGDTLSFTEGRRDEDLFHVANALVKGGMPNGEIEQLLSLIGSRVCNPPFPDNEIYAKVKSALTRKDRQEVNFAQAIRNWVMVSTGTFGSQDVDNEGTKGTTGDRRYIAKVLRRLAEEGVIERTGSKNGYYRRIETEIEKMEWRDASTTPFEIKWPFKVEELVSVYPGNLIVVAGESNAGKTAFMLNVARLNMHQGKDIVYFSSEMDESELKVRLLLFEEELGVPLDDWDSGINFYKRTRDFHDIIKPDAINIIDFFEISDAFYKIAGSFTRIWEKLDQGIVIVALQKDPNAAVGRGGPFSEEKARLYLNIMKNYPAGQLIEIRKGKNNNDKSADGMELSFTTRKGCLLTPNGEWYFPERKRRTQ